MIAPAAREQARRLVPPVPDLGGPGGGGPGGGGAGGAPAALPTATLLVVRHAHAGDREKWDGPDERRPLSKRGRRQAAALVDLLADFEVDRIVSSRYVRCLESVVPLACDRRRAVEIHPALAEGSSVVDLSAFVAELAGAATALCTHGDVVWNLVVELAHRPVGSGEGDGDELPMAKGSTWVVKAQGSLLAATRYLPPPPRST